MSSGVDRILDGRAGPGGFGQRLPRDLPTQPKRDPLTPAERAEVERRVKTGQVDRVERGAQALVDLDYSIEEQKARGGRIARRQMKFRALAEKMEAAVAHPEFDRATLQRARERGPVGAPPAAERQPAPAAAPPRKAPERPLSRTEAEPPGLERLATVDVDRERAAPIPSWSEACEIVLIKVARLRVAPSYQRGLGRNGLRRIRRIAESFDWARFGAIVVRRVGKVYEVIDGQHRAAAARTRGVRRVPAIIVNAAGAQIFLGLNRDRANLDAAQLYHAELAAGEGEAAQVDAILSRLGLSVPRSVSQAGLGARQLRAVGVLRVELRQRGAATLEAALRVLVESWGDRPGVFGAEFIRALCRVVAEIEKAPDLWQDVAHELVTLAVTLESREPEEWLREAKAASAAHGGAAHGHLARIICNAHGAQGGVEIAVGV